VVGDGLIDEVATGFVDDVGEGVVDDVVGQSVVAAGSGTVGHACVGPGSATAVTTCPVKTANEIVAAQTTTNAK
jgi:hypothetical protein